MSAPGPVPALRVLPAIAALLVGLTLWVVHTTGFSPQATRYRQLLLEAGEMGATLDPRLAVAPLPPRVTDFFRRNSVAAADADRLAQSGFLATDLVRRVSETAAECAIAVAGSQPGAATQTAASIEVRAHLELQGRYEQIVELLDDLAREGALYRVEELAVTPLPGGRVRADLEITRMLLKRGRAAR